MFNQYLIFSIKIAKVKLREKMTNYKLLKNNFIKNV